MNALAAVTICTAILALMATLLTFAASSVVTLDQTRRVILGCAIVPRRRGAQVEELVSNTQLCIGMLIGHDQVARLLRFVFYQLPLLRWRMHISALLIVVPLLGAGGVLVKHVNDYGFETDGELVWIALLLTMCSFFPTFVVAALLFLFGQRAQDLREELERLAQEVEEIEFRLHPGR